METPKKHGDWIDQQCLRQVELRSAETPEEQDERVERKCVRKADLRDMELPEWREYQLENDRNGMIKSDKWADNVIWF